MFKATPVYKVDGEVVFGLMVNPVLPDPTDRIYIVTQATENKLSVIADMFYENSELWWILASVNKVIDAQFGVPRGTRLRIPSKTRLAGLQLT